jgi:hypothetical protein
VSLLILELAIALGNYGSVREYVVKLQHTLETGSSASATTASASGGGSGAGAGAVGSDVAHFVKIASALEALRNEEYPRAASVLMQMTTGRSPGSPRASDDSDGSSNAGGGNGSASAAAAAAAEQHSGNTASWPTVLCGEEIALYAGLMALCVLSRRDVVALAEHAEALELAPSVRECLWQFHRGNYQAAWDLLNWPQLKLDCHLGPHVPRLQGLVVKRAILAYWQPYLRVDLPTMARELSGLVPNAEFLVRHMVDVIGQSHSPARGSGTARATRGLAKLLDTRIDLPNRTLVREVAGAGDDGEDEEEEDEAEARAALKLRGLAANVLDDGYSTIVRLACLDHGLIVRDASASAGGGGGGTTYPPRRGRAPRPARTGPFARPEFRRAPAAPEREVAGLGPGGDEDYPVPMDDDDDDDELVSLDDDGVAEEKVEERADGLAIDEDSSGDEDMGVRAAIDHADDMNPEDLY